MRNQEIVEKIQKLKEERRAIILAHNYQNPEIQDIADFTGDSLELSRTAAETDASVIVFCGVHFMAETAAILNPERIVLLPRLDAGCPMADMITADDLRKIREKYPDAPIVTYVNSTAEVKALSTVCCTSANVIKVVSSLSNHPLVYMTPDRNLALYASRHVKANIAYWDGYCPIHDGLRAEDVLRARKNHPNAVFIAHPECRPEVIELADHVFSTSGMLRFVEESDHDEFIIGTEVGILYPMKKRAPDKKFHPASERMVCANMKKTTILDVLRALETLEPRVTVPEDVRKNALSAILKMLEMV
ncbi:quinolinate synthase NadA [Thermodesulforhabdus norvegica]|uniref:Quinolinate synthase n=1 Tax=Thermodesulforhabdus norvegica TaxID=39841 RepID=A0A1I4VA69_9BACT|nr:quinolinate synthase NadA [Thermodesulforhabdus norvegica]SFM98073.1 quinolinate synthetase [Thermodesulforhabdus norvegica]